MTPLSRQAASLPSPAKSIADDSFVNDGGFDDDDVDLGMGPADFEDYEDDVVMASAKKGGKAKTPTKSPAKTPAKSPAKAPAKSPAKPVCDRADGVDVPPLTMVIYRRYVSRSEVCLILTFSASCVAPRLPPTTGLYGEAVRSSSSSTSVGG